MSAAHERERRVIRRLELGDPYWPAQLAVGLAIVVNLALSSRVRIGPRLVVPVVEGLLLIVVIWLAPSRATRHGHGVRWFALTVIGLVSLTNLVSLGLLVDALLNGGRSVAGRPLILSGAGVLATNVLLFAVWFWELDRGGPAARYLDPTIRPDFQFPQMENPQLAPPNWRPGFGDYLYLSLTNATAFSPTDTMPLTHPAKALMALQSVSSLIIVGLVVARAVNILS